MTDWAAEQKSLHGDFQAEGFEITVRAPGAVGEYDPDTDSYPAADPQDFPTYALQESYEASQIDGKIIQKNDYLLKVPAYGLPTLATSHEILIGGVTRKIIHIEAVAPANTPLLYNVQVRS